MQSTEYLFDVGRYERRQSRSRRIRERKPVAIEPPVWNALLRVKAALASRSRRAGGRGGVR